MLHPIYVTLIKTKTPIFCCGFLSTSIRLCVCVLLLMALHQYDAFGLVDCNFAHQIIVYTCQMRHYIRREKKSHLFCFRSFHQMNTNLTLHLLMCYSAIKTEFLVGHSRGWIIEYSHRYRIWCVYKTSLTLFCRHGRNLLKMNTFSQNEFLWIKWWWH